MMGFGRSGRRTQLRDFIRKEQLDTIFLQETMRQDFADQELLGLVNGELFHWHWRAAPGRSGGMLLGIKDESFEVGSIDLGPFLLSATVFQRESKFKFEIVGVYGPADHARSATFLNDLESKVENCSNPVVVLGDFNLIRGAQDKNNANINWPLVNAFNDCIARLALREVACTGAHYTWSNRQRIPVRCVLDRVLVSPEWETQFLLSLLRATTCLGSDHSPLVLDTGSSLPKRTSRFFFESSWLSVPGFLELVKDRWAVQAEGIRRCRGPIDWWHSQSTDIRQFLKGWSANLGKDSKDAKANLLARIQQLDSLADGVGLDEQRGRQQWLLQGDANTKFFHAFANGRKRKCVIHALSSDNGLVTEPAAIQALIYDFYQGLMGSEEEKLLSLSPDLWGGDCLVSPQENDDLMRSFTAEELYWILKDTKSDTAPGPDGLPVIFFKKFWPLLRKQILAILNGFALGIVDIARLNFGILSLIPKVPGAYNIKQFRPIALINVIFKLVSKAFAFRLSPVAHRIISQAQTAFIKGRFI
jgi:endonuclease/exonuclease/phosphatase family metal-dependent hydrolase